MDIAESVANGKKLEMPTMDFDSGIKGIKEIGKVRSRYYIRFMAADKPGVLAAISGVLARFKISIASVTQKERHKERAVPIVMMTHEAVESGLRKALNIINRLDSICGKPVAIRMEMK
jgi:homoserine dehydrogenase